MIDLLCGWRYSGVYRETGAVINVPCPSQNSENEYMQTADFWNEVRKTLRAKYGEIGIAAQCAAAGDLSPRTLHYRQAEKRRYALKYGVDTAQRTAREMCNRYDIVERICQSFDEVLGWAKKDMIYEAEVKHTVKTIFLEQRLISEEEYAYAKKEADKLESIAFLDSGNVQADFKENTKLVTNRGRMRDIVERYETQKLKKEADMELHVVKIGEIAFASCPYELYIDYQHQIQARSPFTQTYMIQLAAQPEGYKSGYLATERAVLNRGYSASMYCNQISWKGGDQLVEETLNELNRLY